MAHRHRHEAPGVVDPASLGEPGSQRETAKDRPRQPVGHRHHQHEAPGVADPASLGEGGSVPHKEAPRPPIGHRHPHEGPGAADPASLGETTSSRQKEQTMSRKDKDKVEGEGSYTGTKDYNERTRKFVDSGKVEEAAREAEPKSEQEKHEMQKAERIGKEKAKGEDPALNDPKKVPHEGHRHNQQK
jgi:hypothetical protein